MLVMLSMPSKLSHSITYQRIEAKKKKQLHMIYSKRVMLCQVNKLTARPSIGPR